VPYGSGGGAWSGSRSDGVVVSGSLVPLLCASASEDTPSATASESMVTTFRLMDFPSCSSGADGTEATYSVGYGRQLISTCRKCAARRLDLPSLWRMLWRTLRQSQAFSPAGHQPKIHKAGIIHGRGTTTGPCLARLPRLGAIGGESLVGLYSGPGHGSNRMRWDSNPRYAYTYGGFQDRCLKPLGHSSRCAQAYFISLPPQTLSGRAPANKRVRATYGGRSWWG
jgi:hypothetical protein